MKKFTLLEMTQNILSAMNSDEVNSISDTVESQQVAEEIRNTFYDLFSNRDLPEFEGLVNLTAVADEDNPTQMILPTNVLHIKWLKYRNWRANGAIKFSDVEYLSPEEFIRRIVEMDMGGGDNYQEVTLLSTSPITWNVRNNKAPDYYTVFDEDHTLVFDSFDATYEDFLTSSNAIAWALKSADFDLEDSFVPPIDAELFPLLIAEAKSACFINIKEVSNAKEEQRSRRQLVRSQRRLSSTEAQREGVFTAHNYARNRRGRSVFRRNYYRGS